MKTSHLFLILVLGACAGNQTPVDLRPRLIAFGDSYTARPNNWAGVVADKKNLRFINNAVDSTRLASDNQLPLVLKYPFQPDDTAVMLLGYNDVALYQKDPAGLVLFKQELAQLVARFSAAGIQTYIGTACDVPPGFDATYGVDTSDRPLYVQAIKDAVALGASNIHLVDVNAQFVPVVGVTLLVDQHPNVYGHQLIANMFLEVM